MTLKKELCFLQIEEKRVDKAMHQSLQGVHSLLAP